jgi:hypothetical protein
MADQDWPCGYEVVNARDSSGRIYVPTRVGLRHTEAGLAVAAECDDRVLIFPLPEAARFAGAFQRAIAKHVDVTGGEL